METNCKKCNKPFTLTQEELDMNVVRCQDCRKRSVGYNRKSNQRKATCKFCGLVSKKIEILEGPEGGFFCNGDCFLQFLIEKAKRMPIAYTPCQTCEAMYDECIEDGLLDPRVSDKQLKITTADRELVTLTFDPDEEFLEPLPQVM